MNHYHSHLKAEVFSSGPARCLLLFSLANMFWVYLGRTHLLDQRECSESAR